MRLTATATKGPGFDEDGVWTGKGLDDGSDWLPWHSHSFSDSEPSVADVEQALHDRRGGFAVYSVPADVLVAFAVTPWARIRAEVARELWPDEAPAATTSYLVLPVTVEA